MAKKKINKKAKKVPPPPTPEQQYEYMISRYGSSAKWGEAVLHLTYDEMVGYFGEQCEEFEPLCANCTNWVQWNKTGTANISFERDNFVKLLSEGKL